MKKERNYLKQLSKETKALKTPSMSIEQVNDLITGKMIYCYARGILVKKFKANDFRGYLRQNLTRITAKKFGSKNGDAFWGQEILTFLQAKKLAIYGQITIKGFGGYYYTTILK